MIKKIFKHFEGINGLIFAIYVAVIFTLRVLTLDNCNIWMILLSIAAVFFVSLLVCPKLFDWIRALKIPANTREYTKKERRIWFLIFFAVNFAVFFIRYVSVYPGGFVADNIYQYTQMINNSYNDWHPALHTFIFFTIPYKLTGNIGSIVFMQVIYLSFSCAYMEYVLMLYAGKKYSLITLIYILLNPGIQSLAVIPTKDTAFSIASMVLMTYTLHIFFTKGKWINKKLNIVLFSVFAVLAVIFRHNAILLILPLCIAVMFYIEKKQRIQITALFILIFISIKIPLYTVMQVKDAEKRCVEMAGMPMTIIANVVKEHPESLDDELKEFAYSIATQEAWNDYQCGNFNSIKWSKSGKNFNLDVLDDVGIFNVCRLAVKCIVIEPTSSLKAAAVLFNRVVAVDGDVDWHQYTETADNSVGIEKSGGGIIDDLFISYADIIMSTVFKYLFYFTGIINLIILSAVMAKMKFSKHWKKILLCIPLLIHNWGTMLLLSGIDFRFFIVSFFIFTSIILIILREDKSNSTEESEKIISERTLSKSKI